MSPDDVQFVESVVLSVLSKNFPGDPRQVLRSAEAHSGVKLAELAKSNVDRFLGGVSSAAAPNKEAWETKFVLGVLRRILEKHA